MSFEYKHGNASFVELGKNKAKKHMPMAELYWLKEYTTLLYLWKYNHSNIIRYESGSYLKRKPPKENIIKYYYEITFPRYPKTLEEVFIKSDPYLLQIMVDLLSAVSLCHKLKIWHRDIKPANILLNYDARAILIDFTHSIRVRTDDLKLDQQVSTYSHRAPEVFRYQNKKEKEYDEKIDVWSLGVILFEMVTHLQFYKKVTHESSESALNHLFNNCKQSYYLGEIQKVYKNYCGRMKYADQYWIWIKKMLTYDVAQRPSAQNMLDEVVKFCTDMKIEIQLPSHKDINNQKEPFLKPKFTDFQHEIFIEAGDLLREFHDILNSHADIDEIINICKILISMNSINISNILYHTLALYIIISVIIYDDIFYIEHVIHELNLEFDDIKFDQHRLQKSIMDIMTLHESDLFLYDKYIFKKTDGI